MNNHTCNLQLSKGIMLVLITSAVLLFSGCEILLPAQPIAPTATATQTETPTPTIDWFPATPTTTLIATSSPTPLATLPDLRKGVTELLVTDDFTEAQLWKTPQGEAGNVAFGNENLTLAVARQNASLFSLSQHNLSSDFYLEISVLISLCQPSDQVGFIFWHQSDSDFYRLLINCAGQHRLELIQSGQSIVIHDWDTAAQIQLGSPATNRVGIWVSRGNFQLFINDTFQLEVPIAKNQAGALGVFARTVTGSVMTVRFSDLQIYRVEPD